MSAFWSGFITRLSLILAIGAQNAFVLKQGIKKEHIFAVCLICALGDALLIFAGVFGFAKVLQKFEFFKHCIFYSLSKLKINILLSIIELKEE